MLYCINNRKKGRNNASSKAPADITTIAVNQCGAKAVPFYESKHFNNYNLTRLLALFTGIANWNRLEKNLKQEDIVILQHPYENLVVANRRIDKLKKRGVKFISLIHDLNSIRYSLDSNSHMDRHVIADEKLLRKCDIIICHNEAMRNYLKDRGFDTKKMVVLGIFDYLHDNKLPETRDFDSGIVVAGNLAKVKCEYLYKLAEDKNLPFDLNLYGIGYSGETNSKVTYCGSYTPDELPSKLEGAFGLVWDGTDIYSCSGTYGEYLRFNNPHKCSLFLSSNLPVIIWEKAALAPLIKENNLGIAVDSLDKAGETLSVLTQEQYSEMVANTKRFGRRLRNGEFFEIALKTALERLNKE